MLDTVLVTAFGNLAHGRAHEGLDDEQLHALLQGIKGKQGGNGVATMILGMRIFGRHSDKLPISESLKATGREFLSRVKLEKGAQLDHMMAEVIKVAFDKPEREAQARAFCAKVIAALGGWEVSGWDLGDTITALAKTFPVVVLDILVEQAVDEDGMGQTLFQDIRGNRTCPLDAITNDVLIAWATQKPETRYELLARVVRFSNAGDEEHADGWSPAARMLIDAAPESVKVLDTLYRRFTPNGWSGSLADVLATRMPLLEALKHHPRADVSAWANAHALAYRVHVDRQRAVEAAEHRARDQTFE